VGNSILIRGFLPFLSLLLLTISPLARADVGLILSEATSHGMSRWTNAGHSAVYLSRACPASPVKLRLCEPGENGSVVSNYIRFQENLGYEWNAVPLNIFLYGVEDEEARPLFASASIRQVLQERFRDKYLQEICFGPPCTTDPDAHWRDLVADSFARGMYIFVVKTTVEQDLRIIAELNSRPNVNRYSGFINNCADFAARIINSYFPHAAKPDHLNDFGMTSPKAIAKSFAHFAARHPELEYRVIRVPQLPGSFPRSRDCRKGTEVAFHSKRWLLPMLLKSPHELALFAASYALTGRFNPHRELDRHSAMEAGSHEQWKQYRESLNQLLADNPEDRSSNRDIGRLARDLEAHGETVSDPTGATWMQIDRNDSSRRVGLSAGNINAAGSDPQLAYRIMLARVQSQLNNPNRRESLPAFAQDWSLLEASRASWLSAMKDPVPSVKTPEETEEALGGGLFP
jgi:hypothetical protein